MVWALLLGFVCRPVPAQGVPGRQTNIGVSPTGASDLQMRQLEELANEMPAVQRPHPTCILQPYPDLSNTVSLRSLEVPEKVQDEYEKACTALHSQKFAESEKHLRKALERSSLDGIVNLRM
jgi:hypothetical protein